MNNIREIIDAELREQVIHGAVVLCGTPSHELFRMETGYNSPEHNAPMRLDTVIDIASITKVCACVTGLLVAHSRGLIDFEAPFTQYLPQYQPQLKNMVRVRDLANHTSGFHEVPEPATAQRRYFSESGHEMLQNVFRLPPPFAPSRQAHYACWNYILLAQILEQVTGCPFPEFCRKEIFEPLGMSASSIGAPCPGIPADRIARTERAATPGAISDSVAFRFYRDGLSTGNAGMFSTAEDLAKLMKCHLNHGEYATGKYLFSKDTFAEIAPDRGFHSEGYRRFGWTIWADGMREEDFGSVLLHHGYTGQTLLMHLPKRLFCIVLTTRFKDYARAKKDRMMIISRLLQKFAS
ncbi:MAG: beta-lactamase family protein [Lentisphaerae bacterium]|mgnify:CR=1 FL=1|jgi:CubicO group peptidase (beta-lactamase class C family)|nr:beta-lactamase family protein [Lentisphaerota bacterium]